MIKNKIKLLLNGNGIFAFAMLSLADKLLLFLLPFIFLFLYGSENLFARVEYVLSIVTILLAFSDFGLRSYMFYSYKIAGDKAILQIQKAFFNLCVLYMLLAALFFWNSTLLFVFVWLLYMQLSSYLTNYWRINDKPSRVYIFTLSSKLLALLLASLLFFIIPDYGLYGFYSIFALFSIIFLLQMRNYLEVFNKEMLCLCWDAIKYAWPIMLNLLLVSFLGGYAKIYLYSSGAVDEMVEFAIIQKASYVLVLLHIVISGYYNKFLYIGGLREVEKKIMYYFLCLLLLSLIGVLSTLVFIQYWRNGFSSTLVYCTILLFMYSFFWCCSAFLEMLYGRVKKNIYVLFVNLISSVTFIIVISVYSKNAYVFAFAMMLSMFVGFAMSLFFYITKIREKIKVET